MLRLAFPNSAATEWTVAQAQLAGINEVQALTLLSRAPTLAEACHWWTHLGQRGNSWPPLVAPTRCWEEYCAKVANAAGEDAQRASRVFGCCVRCGSNRLLVTNKQLRRARRGLRVHHPVPG